MIKKILLLVIVLGSIGQVNFAQNMHAKVLRKKLETEMKVHPAQIDSFLAIQSDYENAVREIHLNHHMKQIDKDKCILKLQEVKGKRLQRNTLTTQQFNQVITILNSLKNK
ncbi:MAG: hypothetical protein RL708_2137 [Bacteroidota bacterium]|jgi:hypothetical protein